jgi:hypothetical protein
MTHHLMYFVTLEEALYQQVFLFQKVSELVKFLKMSFSGQALVAHAYNPSYSGGREQEDWDLKSAWANRSRDPT